MLGNTGTMILNFANLSLDPPSILVFQPVIKVIEGNTAMLVCGSEGNPSSITTKWSRNGEILDDRRFKVQGNGTLQITSVRYEDHGKYVCEVFNSVGKGESKTAEMQVQGKTQTASQSSLLDAQAV